MVRIFAVWLLAFPLFGQVVPDLYLVELASQPAILTGTDHKLVRQQMATRRAGVRAEQQSIRQALPANVAVLASLELVANALVVRANEADADAIRLVPGIARVSAVFEMKPDLDAMAVLHRVPEAWARVGGQEKAGAGMKIGILDTGIDRNHAGFQDDTLPELAGYPKASHEAFKAMMSKKIIVARNYDNLISSQVSLDFDDPMGHGTAVAMVAAGVSNSTQNGVITGFAPRAYLGVYRIFSGATGVGTNVSTLKGIDDAVADGMDMINISSGVAPAPRSGLELVAEAVERAISAGVMVVTSAGNNGPELFTMNGPATANSIVVGASYNSRRFGMGVKLDDVTYTSLPGSGPTPAQTLNGKLADAAAIDPTGLLCNPAPKGSLQDVVVLIARGVCFFEDKLNNAQSGGAIGAVIFTDDRPPSRMAVGTATLPAMMVGNADGLAMKKRILAGAAVVSLLFNNALFAQSPMNMAEFSSRGPSVEATIKPDVTAVGADVLTATQSNTKTGKMFDATGYTVVDGTSFSSPAVAGALAVLKSGRPGLTLPQYRSLLINSAAPMVLEDGKVAPVQVAGAGLLDLDAALRNSVAIAPVSASFGFAGRNPDFSRALQLANVSADVETYDIRVESDDAVAANTDISSVQLNPGEVKMISLNFKGKDLAPGEYQGFMIVRGRNATAEARVAYWYGIPDSKPKSIKFWEENTGNKVNASGRIRFQITDIAGLPVYGLIVPKVTATSGNGAAFAPLPNNAYSGIWDVSVRLGPVAGTNTFHIEAGDAKLDIAIPAQ